MDHKIFHTAPKSGGKGSKRFLKWIIMLIAALAIFYFGLPAINLHSGDLFRVFFVLSMLYILLTLFSNGYRPDTPGVQGVKIYVQNMKAQCKPTVIAMVAVAALALVGQLTSITVFRSKDYRALLDVQTGNLVEDMPQISFEEIPTLGKMSADYLGDRQMGTLSDMVSQFEYSFDSSQINYQGRPVRVAPVDYADLFKWLANRKEGLPAYVIVDMVTQKAEVVRLPEGMKYSYSEPLNRNIMRHLRFHYPTKIFSAAEFEIDEQGHPWWIAPEVVKRIGLFGGRDVCGAVLVDAVTGECTYYDAADVPTWVDNLYPAGLFAEQYDYYGTLVHGFINSFFGQKDVTKVTDINNYIAMNDDVYMYTGVTSANSDASIVGFLLCNMRTKVSTLYKTSGATETAAMLSAQGEVQDLGYMADYPLLLNIGNVPTYFIPLMDNSYLVKTYAMVNVAQSQIVATGSTVAETEKNYIAKLLNLGIVQDTQFQPVIDTRTVTGAIAEIRSAVLEGNTYYFFRLDGQENFYSVSAAKNTVAVILNVGDTITVEYDADGDSSSILSGYTVTLEKKAPAVFPGSVGPGADQE